MIQTISINYLNQLKALLQQLTDSQYSQYMELLHNSSIGMHARHIVEFYLCLLDSSSSNMLNYDVRNRDTDIQCSTEICGAKIDYIIKALDDIKVDYPIKLHADYSLDLNNQLMIVDSTFYRELIYNVEHVIHHLAIIKIGVNAIDSTIKLSEDFGVAASTIRNRKACAQ